MNVRYYMTRNDKGVMTWNTTKVFLKQEPTNARAISGWFFAASDSKLWCWFIKWAKNTRLLYCVSFTMLGTFFLRSDSYESTRGRYRPLSLWSFYRLWHFLSICHLYDGLTHRIHICTSGDQSFGTLQGQTLYEILRHHQYCHGYFQLCFPLFPGL